MDDHELLQQPDDAPAVLTRLVERHVPLVFSTCRRQLGDPTLADQSTAAVFVLLAAQLPSLRGQTSLVPWLFDTAHAVCAMSPCSSPPSSPGFGSLASDWLKLAPAVDDAIASLPDAPREAFLLKYVANLPINTVAAALDVSATAAGQRIADAVARLRHYFESRNVAIAPDALVAAVQSHLVQPAPPHVAQNTFGTLASSDPTNPARRLATALTRSSQRERWITLLSVACVLFALGFGFLKLQAVLRNASAAATQPATAPTEVQSTVPAPTPQLPPKPDDPLPTPKPIKPVDPDLARRFIAAVRRSDTQAIQHLVDLDENVINAKDVATGRSAVEIAADLVFWNKRDATSVARFLIRSGAVTTIHTAARAGDKDYVALQILADPKLIESKDAQRLTPLQRAALLPGASPECEEVVDMLIQAGAKVDLWSACTLGRLGDVQQEVADHPEQVNQLCLGASPLNWAVRPRQYASDPLAIPKLLLEKGADPRSRDLANDGMTPLHHAAAWGGQATVADLLLAAGVDVNIPDDFAWTPLDYAVDRGRKEMVEFFKSKGGHRTTLDYPARPAKTARFYAAVEAGDVDLTNRLLDDTPELALSRGPTGETPLHWAAALGSIPMIDRLLSEKADIDAQETNKFGGTPLQWAVRHDRPDAVKHLLAKGADPKALNQRSGQSALHVAAQHTDDDALLTLLLQAGLNPTQKDRFGKSSLDYATQAGHAKIAAALQK